MSRTQWLELLLVLLSLFIFLGYNVFLFWGINAIRHLRKITRKREGVFESAQCALPPMPAILPGFSSHTRSPLSTPRGWRAL